MTTESALSPSSLGTPVWWQHHHKAANTNRQLVASPWQGLLQRSPCPEVEAVVWPPWMGWEVRGCIYVCVNMHVCFRIHVPTYTHPCTQIHVDTLLKSLNELSRNGWQGSLSPTPGFAQDHTKGLRALFKHFQNSARLLLWPLLQGACSRAQTPSGWRTFS